MAIIAPDNDTPPHESPEMLQLMRSLSPAERLQRACSFSEIIFQFVKAGIALRHPEASALEIQKLYKEHRMREYMRLGQLW
jgi:hypothetical protein